MRVQEALNTLGYAAGTLDGIFGLNTGAAVSAYKSDHGLQPTDPVVGPGTSAQLDADLFTDPAYLDPAFGEVASYVAAQVIGPLRRIRDHPPAQHAAQLPTPQRRILPAVRAGLRAVPRDRDGESGAEHPGSAGARADQSSLANLRGSGITVPFAEADGTQHVAIGFRDITLMGRRVITDVNGLTARVGVREVLCHEVTHLRNEGTTLGDTPDTDGTVFLEREWRRRCRRRAGPPPACSWPSYTRWWPVTSAGSPCVKTPTIRSPPDSCRRAPGAGGLLLLRRDQGPAGFRLVPRQRLYRSIRGFGSRGVLPAGRPVAAPVRELHLHR